MSTSTLPSRPSESGSTDDRNAFVLSHPIDSTGPDIELLRDQAWDVGERKPAEAFVPMANHVGLAMVSPGRGFAHWRILNQWIQRTSQRRGDT